MMIFLIVLALLVAVLALGFVILSMSTWWMGEDC